MIAFMIGGPASAFGTQPVTASPIAAKQPAPTMTTSCGRNRLTPVGKLAS